jgi:hypothetical protein
MFATARVLSGYADGVLVRHVDGRPIKVEGNPVASGQSGRYRPDRTGGESWLLRPGPQPWSEQGRRTARAWSSLLTTLAAQREIRAPLDMAGQKRAVMRRGGHYRARAPGQPDAGVRTPEPCPYRLNKQTGSGDCVHVPSCPGSVQHCPAACSRSWIVRQGKTADPHGQWNGSGWRSAVRITRQRVSPIPIIARPLPHLVTIAVPG